MTQDYETLRWEAPLFRTRRWYRNGMAWLVLILCACAPAWASEELTVLVMPIERVETSGKPAFTQDAQQFPHLVFENTAADWRSLKIGDHHWLCGELDAFARSIDAKVHVRFVHWNEALHSIVALRNRYDVVQVPSTWTAHLIEKKVLAKWDGLDASQYHPQVLRSCSIEGEKDVYAVPWHIDLRVLFYRGDFTSDPSKLVTYDGFVECLRAAQERAKGDANSAVVAPFGVGAERDWDILHNLFAYYTNGTLFEKQDGRWCPAFHVGDQRGGLKKFWRLIQEGLVCYSTRDPAGDERIAYGLAESLADGKCLAVFGGPHMRWTFDKHPDIQAVPLPQLHPQRNYSFLGGCHLAVSAAVHGRGNDRNARALVRWLTREEAQRALAEQTDALPANSKALDDFFEKNPRWSAFHQALKHGVAYLSIPPWAEFESKDVRDGFDVLRRRFEQQADWDGDIGPKLDSIAESIPPWPTLPPPPPPRGDGETTSWIQKHLIHAAYILLTVTVGIAVCLVLRYYGKGLKYLTEQAVGAIRDAKSEILEQAGSSQQEAMSLLIAMEKTIAELDTSVVALRSGEEVGQQQTKIVDLLATAYGEITAFQDENSDMADRLDKVVPSLEKIAEILDKAVEKLSPSPTDDLMTDIKPKIKAMVLLMNNPRLTIPEIAELVGVHQKTPYKWTELMALCKYYKVEVNEGHKDVDRNGRHTVDGIWHDKHRDES